MRNRNVITILFVIIIILALVLTTVYLHHKIQSKREAYLRVPIGNLTKVNGHNMSIYEEGTGDKTIVFLAGGGTCSPILDFKSLYSLLSDDYKVVVVEKFGYGFSDIVDKERTIDSILEDTRRALKNTDIQGPYVLCPHSMSGIESLYWAQKYPGEVEAIIGLDMAVPEAYENYKIGKTALKLAQFARRSGLLRMLPSVSESDSIKHGTLTKKEKKIYRALFYEKSFTTTMMNEVASVKDNAKIVKNNKTPQIPILLFISNGDGTGWNREEWINYQENYIKGVKGGKTIKLDCPHYVHDYRYEIISKEIKSYLNNLDYKIKLVNGKA